MSAHLDDIRSAVCAVMARAADGDADPTAWKVLDELGFTSLTMPTELGGSGGDLCDAAAVTETAALAKIPLGEALFLAGPLLAAANLQWPDGMTTAANAPAVTVDDGGGPRLSGRVPRVPWLRCAQRVVLALGDDADSSAVAVVDTGAVGVTIKPGTNLAGEQRDDLLLDRVEPLMAARLPAQWDPQRVHQLGATCRASQMAGAARQALELTTVHVSQRVQFGRPLVKFQAVQHMLAQLAADVATVRMAADTAVLAMREQPTNAGALVAAAKAEASTLARSIAATSHQLHGALGFSQEHALGACTRRLWAWREEFGNEAVWQRRLADDVSAAPGGLWPLLTDTAPPRQ